MSRTRIARFVVGTPASPTITLVSPLTASAADDTVYLSAALPISVGELASCDIVEIVVSSTGSASTKAGFAERMSCTVANYDATAKTMSSCTRALIAYGGTYSQDTSLLGAHPAGADVDCPVDALDLVQIDEILGGTRGTGIAGFIIGDGTTGAIQGFEVDGGGANTVIFGIDTSGNPVIRKADGSSFTPGAGSGSISGGDGIDLTSTVISVDLDAGTDVGLEIDTAKLKTKNTKNSRSLLSGISYWRRFSAINSPHLGCRE